MAAPYAPPPTQTPEQVPPNRRPGASPLKTLALWLVLIVLFVAFYNFFGQAPASRGRGPDPVPEEAPPRPPRQGWPLSLPLVTYGALGVALMVMRRRLPAKYRTFELRELPAQKPDVAPVANPTPIDLTLNGTDLQRPVRLRIHNGGLQWHVEKRLLQPAQELEVGWEELESIATGKQQSTWAVWGLAIGFIGLFQARTDWRFAAAGVVAGAIVALIGWKRTRGLLSFATPSHTLTFASRELGTEQQDAIMQAARERRPQAVRPPAKGGCGTALYWLVLEPFTQLIHPMRSDATVRAMLLRDGANFPDEETALSATVQRKMFAVWSGGLRGVGPLSCSLGMALWSREPSVFVITGVFAWIAGLVIATRANTWFARFTGMSIIR